ncbi:MAG: DUF2867 domain-containing protein [Kineosporiaceae bacterium]
MGAQPDPADRDPRRPALPRRFGVDAAARQPRVRHRRARRPHLPGDDDPLREGGGPAAAGDPPAQRPDAAPVEPLGRRGDPRAQQSGPPAGGQPRPRGGLRRARHRRLRARPARGAGGLRAGGDAGAAADPGRGRPDALGVGVAARRPQRPDAGRPRLGRRQPLRRRPDDPGACRRRQPVAGHRGDRRRPRLVLVGPGLAGAGLLDRAVGGPGLRRGRRNLHDLHVGDELDFWRVEDVVEGRLLRLRAEMRLPGLAWLDLSVEEDLHGRTLFRQRAVFHPRGLFGQLYWWDGRAVPRRGVLADAAQHRTRRRAGRGGRRDARHVTG